jgi:thiol:disulfide interchange protein
MMRALLGLLAALSVAAPALAQPVDTGHLVAELVPEARGVAPGQTLQVALRQTIQKGWHTYWRNPGDSGEATKILWTLPAGWTAGDFVWPTPHRLPVGPLVNYGYSGEVLLPMTLTAPASARVGETVTLKAAAAFLVCEEICIPEDALLTLSLPITAGPAQADPKWGPAIAKTLAAAPKTTGLAASFQHEGGRLTLAATGSALNGPKVREAYFYPFSGTAIDHAKPQGVERGPDGLTLAITAGYDFQQGAAPAAIAGVLEVDGTAHEITAAAGPAPAGASGLGPPRALPTGAADLGLLAAAVFAFLGGLILNLMPCVFPVLAMKAASLAGHGEDHGPARRQGLAFGAGVMATFLALAAGLIALQAAGAAVGWGFQLQSPPVVAVLTLLMLAVALNLSGVFEVGASLQGAGSGLATRRGLSGAFFTGALAVVVAAPCTAPFMGPALGWALTQTPAVALTVFAALGLGFAAPFVAVAYVPALLNRLPRPGAWMDLFRKALAFPMYAAAGWLAWVLTVQAGPDALARVLGAAVALGLAAWMAGLAQRRRAVGERTLTLGAGAAGLAALALAGSVWPAYATPDTAGASSEKAEVPYEAYTPERLAALRAQGRPVFVNYTAAWCVSCQVNERVALSTKAVAEALKRNNAAYLKADWTRRDPIIAADLARHGRAGVPLYLVYGANGADSVILPSLLTEGIVVRALDATRNKGG